MKEKVSLQSMDRYVFFRHEMGVAQVFADMPFVAGNLEVDTEKALNGMLVKLRTFLLADRPLEKPVIVREPASWWEMFKRDWFPKAALRRWPVKWVETKWLIPYNVHVCPHANIKWPGNEHLEFMSGGDR